MKGTDDKKTPLIDEEAAKVVKRIFELRSKGVSPHKIADTLNDEGIASPSRYSMEKYGIVGRKENFGLWSFCSVNSILKNPTYLGHMAQQRFSSVSYKNHKRFIRDESEWIVVKNTHEAIIPQELWDKVREVEKSVSQGKKTKRGYTHPLSGFMYCADCGGKMKLNYINRDGKLVFNFNCGNHVRLGKAFCFSHYIAAKDMEEIVISDIREKAKYIAFDEKSVRGKFLERNAEISENRIKSAKQTLKAKQRRLSELDKLMTVAYEDKVNGKIREEICISFLEKYSAEQRKLKEEVGHLEAQISQSEQTEINVEEFITNIRKYIFDSERTREMCFELIDRIVVGGKSKESDKYRKIDIVYKADINSIKE